MSSTGLIAKVSTGRLRAAALSVAIGLIALASSTAAVSKPLTIGFDGYLTSLQCSGGSVPKDCPSDAILGATHDPSVGYRADLNARVTFDTRALDQNADPQIGTYSFEGQGANLSISIGDLTYSTDSFRIIIWNDEFGGFCGNGMRRDQVRIVSSIVRAGFDSCDLAATLDDSLFDQANLSLFGGFSTGPGESLVVDGTYGPSTIQMLGATTAIYRVRPMPEPSTRALLLLGIAAVLLVAHYRRSSAVGARRRLACSVS